jgi:hypothetical protein
MQAGAGDWTGLAQAQSDGWTRPVLVFQGRGLVNSPQVVADRFGQVHGFWSFNGEEASEQGRSLVYHTRLDEPNWQPVDVLITNTNTEGLSAAASGDRLSLLWDGDYYAWADVAPAASAKAWQGPMGLQSGYPHASLATAPDASLWMVYSAVQSSEIYVQRFDSDQDDWGAPMLVGDPVNTNGVPDALRMAVAPDGTLHVVWAEYELPNGWPPQGLYYSQSTDDGRTWSIPRRVAGANTNQPNVVTGRDQEVYLTWTGTAGQGDKYFQESRDGGVSWEEPVGVLVGQEGGSEGAPNLAVDSAGNLHLVVSGGPCVWYVSRVQEAEWGEPECISAPIAPSVQVEFPSMSLGLGNQVHVLFWTDRRQIWYTSKTLPAPGVTPEIVPTQATTTPQPPTPTAGVLPTNTPLPDFGPAPQASVIAATGYLTMAAGVAPVLVVVLALFTIRLRKRK